MPTSCMTDRPDESFEVRGGFSDVDLSVERSSRRGRCRDEEVVEGVACDVGSGDE